MERLLNDALESKWDAARTAKSLQAQPLPTAPQPPPPPASASTTASWPQPCLRTPGLPASPSPRLPISPPLPPQVDTVDTVSRAEYNDLAERHRKALGMIAGAKAEKAAALAKMSELEAEREEARLEFRV